VTYYPYHLAVGLALLVVTLAVRLVTRNRQIHRKLRLSLFLFAAYAAVSVAIASYPMSAGTAAQLESAERLLVAAGLINLVVVLLVNPWRVDRIPDRFPNIVQDTIIIALFLVFGVFVMQEKFLTISAVGGVVVGFALQDTLGNLFAGLAVQIEKPFRVGQWVMVAGYEGRVAEITWRATRLQTKNGTLIVVPHSILSKEAITNFSEPAEPVRLEVDAGVSYSVPPNDVKAAMYEALAGTPGILQEPKTEVLVAAFGDSAITYRVRFWIADFALDAAAKDRVLTAIYYILRRRNYEIPFPMRIQYSRTEERGRSADRTALLESVVRGVDMLAPLSEEERTALVTASADRLFGAGETIVRAGESGSSMFVICSGRVRVTIGPTRQEVATLEAGSYVGEMSLLTGDPRTADVSAVTDCVLLEVTADTFRRIFLADPRVMEKVAAVVGERRVGLERTRQLAAAEAAAVQAPVSLLARIQKFLRLS
jgi:small-conductance mechanosensitive channel/CRP-like cAMP-binding protein